MWFYLSFEFFFFCSNFVLLLSVSVKIRKCPVSSPPLFILLLNFHSIANSLGPAMHYGSCRWSPLTLTQIHLSDTFRTAMPPLVNQRWYGYRVMERQWVKRAVKNPLTFHLWSGDLTLQVFWRWLENVIFLWLFHSRLEVGHLPWPFPRWPDPEWRAEEFSAPFVMLGAF